MKARDRDLAVKSTVFALLFVLFCFLSADRICLDSLQVSAGLICEVMVPSSVKLSSFHPFMLTPATQHAYNSLLGSIESKPVVENEIPALCELCCLFK